MFFVSFSSCIRGCGCGCTSVGAGAYQQGLRLRVLCAVLLQAIGVTNCSRAFWRADVTKEPLQRVYGITFPDKAQLKEYQRRECAGHTAGNTPVHATCTHVTRVIKMHACAGCRKLAAQLSLGYKVYTSVYPAATASAAAARRRHQQQIIFSVLLAPLASSYPLNRPC